MKKGRRDHCHHLKRQPSSPLHFSSSFSSFMNNSIDSCSIHLPSSTSTPYSKTRGIDISLPDILQSMDSHVPSLLSWVIPTGTFYINIISPNSIDGIIGKDFIRGCMDIRLQDIRSSYSFLVTNARTCTIPSNGTMASSSSCTIS